ncbi:hypothetical protein GYMLUDRAFT_774313 [Collybiopsis luxurians FD-317 M1]|uniref:Uncharacterized protein n=1 Tax=Collybiopsis luxurians FD-317 M1 TaxID=944289 RepID=A0A0D0BPW2_9AGAR|nr:hypothetical protein GYMLUDRAFT_774313 [Collybiopsis luxurians FD-317 M1]
MEYAALFGMYGPMTRETKPWQRAGLLDATEINRELISSRLREAQCQGKVLICSWQMNSLEVILLNCG